MVVDWTTSLIWFWVIATAFAVVSGCADIFRLYNNRKITKKQKWLNKEYAVLISAVDLAEVVREHYRINEDHENVMYHLAIYEQKKRSEEKFYNVNKRWIDTK